MPTPESVNRDHHVVARLRSATVGVDACLEVHVRGLDANAAALGHRVPGVDHKVDDHLFELPAIGSNRVEIVGKLRRQRHVLADQPAQHVEQIGHHLVRVQDRDLGHFLAAERQQLPGQRRRAGRSLDDFVQVPRRAGSFMPSFTAPHIPESRSAGC